MDGDSNEEPSIYPAHVEGTPLKRENHLDKADIGLRVICPHHGAECRRFRSLSKWIDEHGEQEPVFYLGSGMSIEEHKSHKPTLKQVSDYVRDQTA